MNIQSKINNKKEEVFSNFVRNYLTNTITCIDARLIHYLCFFDGIAFLCCCWFC